MALETVLVTDCGSTTTKALLFEKKEGKWRQTYRGEAPTTVEAPVADVTVGALNAFLEVQELSGRRILADSGDEKNPFHFRTSGSADGIDLYLSTSSAGGGLQMLVAGMVRSLTTESAERAALGAGAIVMEAISADDTREDHERIDRIRHLKPDIVLMSGGINGGASSQVIELAEILVAASPRPRFGDTLKLPVIYAGNCEIASEVERILQGIAQVVVVENVRPTIDVENLGPAREAIHEFFLSHVMRHSPGYGKLMSWSAEPIMATPVAVGNLVESYAKATQQNILCVDIGGATTDVFSVCASRVGDQRIFNRTVSANLGMSYSVANVLVEAGVDNISRWLPYQIQDSELRDRLRNKMIRPTSIPQTREDLWLEQAVCREALRLSLSHHRSLAVGIDDSSRERSIADIFKQRSERYELVDLMKLDMVIGSGGVLSHAPNRTQAALMMVEGFGLEGITQLAVDSIFMMPHLGIFGSVHPDGANQIFEHDCLIHLGCSVVPVYPQRFSGNEVAAVFLDGQRVTTIKKGEVSRFTTPLAKGLLRVVPLHHSIDVGSGVGRECTKTVILGESGILCDGRNRPFIKGTPSLVSQKRMFEELGL